MSDTTPSHPNPSQADLTHRPAVIGGFSTDMPTVDVTETPAHLRTDHAAYVPRLTHQDDFLEEAAKATSQAEVDSYVAGVRALRGLAREMTVYMHSEDGSLVESLSNFRMEQMKAELRAHPEHAVDLLEQALSFIVVSMDGITFEQWLDAAGVRWPQDPIVEEAHP